MEPRAQPLNSVLGDAGFLASFGRKPGPEDSEALRIKAHLLHMVDQLRKRESAGAPAARQACVSRLEAYARAGCFPRHVSPPEARMPVFIDHSGTPCAVADLMMAFGAEDLCRAIDAAHHTAYLADIVTAGDAPTVRQLEAWCFETGLTLDDLAMIQPGYSESDQRKIMGLVNIGCFSTVAALIMAVAGVAFVASAWPSPSLVECILAGSGCLHFCAALVTVLVVDRPPWPGPNAAAALAYGCVLAPVNLVLWLVLTVSTFAHGKVWSLRQAVCAVTWGCMAVVVVVAVWHQATYKPLSLMRRKFSGAGTESDSENTKTDSEA
mmetsp:Transcript_109250/g.319816  ORF Transcript_109250/g.319816 Transcript_109250/m.319816 type:complete len:323 (+) Transcript_109250:73-1041(+)